MALMAWSVMLDRRNGFAYREVRDEIEHRRREQGRRRFRRIVDRARELAAGRERRRVDPAPTSRVWKPDDHRASEDEPVRGDDVHGHLTADPG